MKDSILHKATDLFLTLGFKSVTMDDIATKMGISKKTIYANYETKTKLIEASTLYLFQTISQGINSICAQKYNPIEELFNIKQFVMQHLKGEQSSPQYQLQKYYPKIHKTLKAKQLEVMEDCVIENLNRGIEQALYRPEIDIAFTSRIYFSGMMSIKDNAIFPERTFNKKELMENYLEYHLRGICSPKGLTIVNTFITKNQL